MSDKDFAQRSTAQVESKRASQASNPKPMVVALLGTMLAITCFSAGFFLGEKYSQENNQGAKHEALLAKLHQQQEENKLLKKEAKRYKEEKKTGADIGELTFYNALPNQSIVPEPLDGHKNRLNPLIASEPQAATAADSPEHYIRSTEEKLNAIIAEELNSPAVKFRIQVASFVDEKDADTLVEQLQKNGVEATVQRVELVNLGIRYRVYTASFRQQKSALQAKQLIQDVFGITGIIITQ